jgi:type IV secretory pathway TraG/TraD family ATPase VirD4
MSATVDSEPLTPLRLPSESLGLCVVLVSVVAVVSSADLARFLALVCGGHRAALVSFSAAARFFWTMTVRRGARSPASPSGRGVDPVVFWSTFATLLALFCLLIVAAARSFRLTTASSDGFASGSELAAVASFAAAKRTAAITRPFLEDAELSKEAVGYPLGVSRRPKGVELVASWETSLALVAPPGAGKTLRVLARILRQHPGPCLATATKPDLYEVSALARERFGPVFALDPDELAPAAERLCWSPVVGCADSAVAERRAGALVSAAGEATDLRSASFFRRSATTVLAAYLHAAALSGATIADVVNWAARPTDPAPLRILAEHADGYIDWGARLHRHTSGAEETTSGVMRSVDLALSPFHHKHVLARCAVAAEDSFDVAKALSSPTTIYALGKDRGSSSSGAGPLITAFCDELIAQAEHEAARRPARRLDPPLLALLDEAPSIVPLPGLPALVADGRGRGITMVLSMQSFSQAAERWGPNGAETIRNASSVTAVFGGLSVAKDLEELSRLSGTRRVPRRSVNEEGSGRRASVSTSSVEEHVLTPAQIRTLKQGELLLFWGRLSPVLAYAPGVWEGNDAKAIARDEMAARERNDQMRGARK